MFWGKQLEVSWTCSDGSEALHPIWMHDIMTLITQPIGEGARLSGIELLSVGVQMFVYQYTLYNVVFFTFKQD